MEPNGFLPEIPKIIFHFLLLLVVHAFLPSLYCRKKRPQQQSEQAHERRIMLGSLNSKHHVVSCLVLLFALASAAFIKISEPSEKTKEAQFNRIMQFSYIPQESFAGRNNSPVASGEGLDETPSAHDLPRLNRAQVAEKRAEHQKCLSKKHKFSYCKVHCFQNYDASTIKYTRNLQEGLDDTEIEIERVFTAYSLYTLGVEVLRFLRFQHVSWKSVNSIIITLCVLFALLHRLWLRFDFRTDELLQLEDKDFQVRVLPIVVAASVPKLFGHIKGFFKQPVFMNGRDSLRSTLFHEYSLGLQIGSGIICWLAYSSLIYFKMFQCTESPSFNVEKTVGLFLLCQGYFQVARLMPRVKGLAVRQGYARLFSVEMRWLKPLSKTNKMKLGMKLEAWERTLVV